MRLIDADALLRDIEKYNLSDGKFQHWVEVQKTVEQPHWISCSERLPSENDYKSCMECLDGAVWYCTENGTIGLGYYYESTKQWSTTDDLRTDGKVVAWMPLPEPYREGEEC